MSKDKIIEQVPHGYRVTHEGKTGYGGTPAEAAAALLASLTDEERERVKPTIDAELESYSPELSTLR